MDRKKMIELVGALFVAAIFLTSYAAFSGNSSRNTTSTSSTVATYYAVGSTNAAITGYNNTLFVNVSCKGTLQNQTVDKINAVATQLENNGSVLTYSSSGNSFQIGPQNMNSKKIYDYIYTKLDSNSTNCTVFSTTATVELPGLIQMDVQGQSITANVPYSVALQQISLTLNQSMPSSLPLRVAALVTANGIVYGSPSITRE
jgi:hypothetical protein